MNSSIQTIMVVGAGQMGAGIAQVCAASGFDVRLFDANSVALDKGFSGIEGRLERQVQKGRLSEADQARTLANLKKVNSIEACQEVDLVIEAVVENMEVKTSIFQELDRLSPTHTILASNTSSLPITEIAAVTNRPEQVIGMHFMNPVPVMQLVEVIRGLQTSDGTFEAIEATAQALNKTAVLVNDFPGFVSNRILMPMINEAIYTVYEGVATPEAVDQVMKLGMNHPMGPLTLADFIGLDTCLSIMEVLHEGFGDDKYRPCPLLRKYVKAGWLGKKTGRGFYTY